MESPDDTAPSEQATQVPTETKGSYSALRLPAILFMTAAIAAGGAFYYIGANVFPVHRPPSELFVPFPPPEIAIAREAALRKARMINATAALATFGLLLGGAMGAAEAAARRFRGGALPRLVGGIVLAVVIGCLAGMIGHLLMEQLRLVVIKWPGLERYLIALRRTTLVEAVMLGVFGFGVGTTLGMVVGSRRAWSTCAIAGALCGTAAGALFPLSMSFLMHRAKTEIIIPGGVLEGRRELVAFALWVGYLTVALGLLMPLVARGQLGKAQAREPSAS